MSAEEKRSNHFNATHGLSNHKLYHIWLAMRNRCYLPTATAYNRYGGKGVRVCDEWRNNFNAFYTWCIDNGYEEGKQLDKDIKGDGFLYSPETCMFVSRKENCNKRTSSVYIEYNGERKTIAEWAHKAGMPMKIFHQRIQRGWGVHKSINHPYIAATK